MTGWLEQPWWQGVAGLAQIIAGGVAIWTLRLALDTLRTAAEQRHEAVAPDWDVVSQMDMGSGADGRFRVELVNSGFGPARKVEVEFAASGPLEMTQVKAEGPPTVAFRLGKTTILPDQRLTYSFWYRHEPGRALDGVLTIRCRTRLGRPLRHRFHVHGWPATLQITRLDDPAGS